MLKHLQTILQECHQQGQAKLKAEKVFDDSHRFVVIFSGANFVHKFCMENEKIDDIQEMQLVTGRVKGLLSCNNSPFNVTTCALQEWHSDPGCEEM